MVREPFFLFLVVKSWSCPMNKKSGSTPPKSDSEHEPELPGEIAPDSKQFEDILQDVVESVRKYREYQRQKEEPDPEPGEGRCPPRDPEG
ncbi:MAG TPA: hypothetical protein VJ725_20480 [Thermoanaerobaculia bacterium]|nr:hypothetical protein [Thermoanaerobaculia bacterium]